MLNLLDGAAQVVCFLLKSRSIQMTCRMGLRCELVKVIADGVRDLIDMVPGTRPLRYPLDAIAQGTDVEFINARAEIKARWLKKYMSNL